jgi:5-oxoprolinase (ATP-hydrolysing)
VNWIERKDGSREDFGARHRMQVDEDDVVVIHTPGGGGYGADRA